MQTFPVKSYSFHRKEAVSTLYGENSLSFFEMKAAFLCLILLYTQQPHFSFMHLPIIAELFELMFHKIIVILCI